MNKETSDEDFESGINYNEIFAKIEKERQDYFNGDEEQKQEYWNKYIFTMWWYNARGTTTPINIVDFKNKSNDLENNFNKFIPGIMESLEDEGFTGDINDIFLLDKETEEYLRGIGYIQNQDTKKKIIEIIENKKEQEILGENISFDELIERIGDLYYDSLSSFIFSLSEYIYNKKTSELLKKASENISNAWDICKKPTLDFLEKVKESDEEVDFKHTSEVKGININKVELARSISTSKHLDLSYFLEKLGDKIQKDGDADKGRGRIKLANELFSCAKNLKDASKI